MHRRLPALVALTFFASGSAHVTNENPVAIAIVNGVVWTADSTKPWAEAVAISGDQIVGVGSSSEIRRLASASTRIIDAKGRMVVPGFIDSHVHFLAGGMNLAWV